MVVEESIRDFVIVGPAFLFSDIMRGGERGEGEESERKRKAREECDRYLEEDV